MNAAIPMHATEPKTLSPIRATCEATHASCSDRLRAEEADRLFEARLQWFLALSAAA